MQETIYTYDNNGSLTGDGTWTHSYDTRNRLINSTDGVADIDYKYDEDTTRTLKDDGTIKTIYDNQYYEEEDDGVSTIERDFVYAGGLKIAKVEDSVVTFNHLDHLSGSNVSTDDVGDVIELNDYYPYGDARIEDKAGGYTNDYMYTGQERDEETGQYYYGARYYDPIIGRFTTQDPWGGDITNPQSFNKYSYVMNNPLRYVDRTGMLPGDAFIRMDQAAMDFGLNYNDNSIANNVEYASSIYSFVDEMGNIFYSYTEPNVGIKNESTPSLPADNYDTVGYVHAHDRYDSILSNFFSFNDVRYADYYGINAYLTAPNGVLRKYNPNASEFSVIFSGLPSDPNDPTRVNEVDPDILPKGEPIHDILDDLSEMLLGEFKHDKNNDEKGSLSDKKNNANPANGQNSK